MDLMLGALRPGLARPCGCWLRALFAGLAVASCGWAAEPPASRPTARLTYRVRAGDTPASLAERYMGGAQYLPELMAYNQIANPLTVTEGTFIGIPGQEREAAMAAIAQAGQAFRVALAAQSTEYAAPETGSARDVLDQAEAARWRAAYDEAKALAAKALDQSTTCKRLADQRAPVPEAGAVTAVFGEVAVSADGGTTFRPAAAGDPLPVGARLRTGSAARAEARLGDGSVVQVLSDTVLEVKDYRRDRRDGRRESELNVIMGSILGRIQPAANPRSTYKLNSRESTIAIRGTELRVGAGSDDVSRLAVLQGLADLHAGRQVVAVPTNFGTYSVAGSPPPPPIELLPPPQVDSPPAVDRVSGQLRYPFGWQRVESGRFAAYHFELSRDPAFNSVEEEVLTQECAYRSGLLADGVHYWRVTTVDRKGMEGRARQGKLTIRRDVGVRFRSAVPPDERDGRWRLRAGASLDVVPVAEDSSVVGIEVSYDGVDYWRFWEPVARFAFPRPGRFVLHARALDAAGVTGPVVRQEVEIGPVAP